MIPSTQLPATSFNAQASLIPILARPKRRRGQNSLQPSLTLLSDRGMPTWALVLPATKIVKPLTNNAAISWAKCELSRTWYRAPFVHYSLYLAFNFSGMLISIRFSSLASFPFQALQALLQQDFQATICVVDVKSEDQCNLAKISAAAGMASSFLLSAFRSWAKCSNSDAAKFRDCCCNMMAPPPGSYFKDWISINHSLAMQFFQMLTVFCCFVHFYSIRGRSPH